jgi:hypothetical protein
MNNIVIREVAACDAGKITLPPSASIANAYLVSITPNPPGRSGTLYIKISCRMVPGGAGTIHYQLRLLSGDWVFTGPDPLSPALQKYDRVTTNDKYEYLEFELKSLKSVGHPLPAGIRIEATDALAAPPPNTALKLVTLSDN